YGGVRRAMRCLDCGGDTRDALRRTGQSHNARARLDLPDCRQMRTARNPRPWPMVSRAPGTKHVDAAVGATLEARRRQAGLKKKMKPTPWRRAARVRRQVIKRSAVVSTKFKPFAFAHAASGTAAIDTMIPPRRNSANERIIVSPPSVPNTTSWLERMPAKSCL